MQYLTFSPNEWRVLSAAVESLKLSDIAEKTGLPYTTVASIIKRLKNKIKITFVPDYYRMGLKPVSIFLKNFVEIKNVPPYTLAVRRLYGLKSYTLITGLVPEKYVDMYIESFPEEPITYIVASDTFYWTPKSKLTAFLPNFNVVVPKIDKNVIYKIAAEKYEKREVEKAKLDSLDVLIIVWKMNYAFKKLTDIIKEAARKYPEFYGLKRQVLSYHFERHVLPLWKLNSIRAYLDFSMVPFRIYFFEGSEAPILAKVLTQLPYFYISNVDVDRAIAFAQPPCSMYKNIYKIISMFDVEMPLGEFVMDSRNLLKRFTDLITMFRDGEWSFPIIKRVRWKH